MIDARERHSVSPRRGRAFFIGLILVLLPATLACTGLVSHIRPASERQVSISRLPTFTRTPLPPLTVATAASLAETVSLGTQPTELMVIPSAVTPAQVSTAFETPTPSPPTAAPAEVSKSVPTDIQLSDANGKPVSPSPSSSPESQLSAAIPTATEAIVVAVFTPTESPTPKHTPAATATEPPLATNTPTATATEPLPTSTPTASPTATAPPEGWLFSGVRLSTQEYEGDMLLYGDVINNTGSTQELAYITGAFYDDQGQVINDEGMFDYWPIEVVPPGGRVPFELTVIGIESIANFDLRVEAMPIGDMPHQEFELLEVSQIDEEDRYCVTGKIRNLGEALNDYLAIIAVLYDAQDNVINFSDYYNYSPKNLVGDQMQDFEICADPLHQEVARHELRPLGF